MAAPVRLDPFPTGWGQYHQVAAELAAQAGAAQGQGIAALGAGIGGGLQASAQRREREEVRAETKAQREEDRALRQWGKEQESAKTRFGMLVEQRKMLQAEAEAADFNARMSGQDPTATLAPIQEKAARLDAAIQAVVSQATQPMQPASTAG